MQYRKIDIQLIDTTSPCWDRFAFIYPRKPEDLTEPLRRFGLLNALKLWKKADGEGYWLISDFKWLYAAMELRWEKVPALVYRKKELSEKEALELALWEIYYGPSLSEGSKASILATVNRCFNLSARQIASKYAPLLRLAPSEILIKDYIMIGNLPNKWLAAMDAELLSLEHVRLFFTFKPEEAEVLLAVLWDNISLNRNETLQFLNLAKDLALIKKCSIKELLSHPELRKIYYNNKLHPKRRGELLLLLMKQMRYPRMHQAMVEFQQSLTTASLPVRVQVQHPPHFEGDWLRFIINSTNEKELSQQLKRLLKLISQGKLTTLFKNI